MGLRDWFGSRRRTNRVRVEAPSLKFPTCVQAIRTLVETDREADDDGQWCSFHATGAAGERVIQLAKSDLNFCTEEIDLAGLMRSWGLSEAAARVSPVGSGDLTLWKVPELTSDEVAIVIDAVFRGPLGLADGYTLVAERHS